MKKKQRRNATPKEKRKAFEMLSEGYSLAQVETELAINRGTLSRWRRSQDFALFHAERTTGAAAKEMKGRIYDDDTDTTQPKVLPAHSANDLDDVTVRGDFLRAVACGGLAWAQDFSGASDEQVAQFIRELDVRKAHAKPRVLALTHMLKLGTDPDVPHAVRAKALIDWWRLADNNLNGGQPMVHIDARGADEDAAPKVAEFIVQSVRDELAKAVDIDLMDEVPVDE